MSKPNLLIIIFLVLFLIAPLSIKAATLYLMPPSQSVYQGDAFIIDMSLDTDGEDINAVEGNLKFLPDSIEIVDLSKGGSFLTLWVQEPELKDGKISFAGGVPGGFKGNGLIFRITFLRKEIGKTIFNLEDDSKVLLNDGKGTPAKLTFLEGSYEVLERPKGLPLISSTTHADQNKWFKSNTLHLHWDLIEGAEYSYLLSKDPLDEPDDIPDKPEGKLLWVGDMEYPNLEDGIYYFFIRQKLPEKDWSGKVTFRAMIDTQKPEPFQAEIGKDPSVFEGKYFLSFSTTDKLSGIDHYEIKEGKKEFKESKSPYVLEDQKLKGKILVKAIDKAGNEHISEITPPPKTFPYYIILILALFIVGVIWLIIRRLRSKRNK